MKECVMSAGCLLEIELNDNLNTKINIEFDEFAVEKNLDNYINSIRVREELSSNNNNPVGIVSSNLIVIELTTRDRKLIPKNKKSPYYGFMDDTAIIRLEIIEDGEYIPFGTFYVDRWYSSVAANMPNKVTIEAYDLFSTAGKNDVPMVKVGETVKIDSFLKDLINEYNRVNDNKRKIQYNESAIVFDEFDTMQYVNLDTTNMSNCLNTISQATLTNIYWSRENKLTTDYCLNDRIKESVCTLSDKSNITDVKDISGALVNYNGVKVSYSVGIVNKTSNIMSINNRTIVAGDNSIENIQLSDGVHKINYIAVRCKDSDAYVEIINVDYTKDVLKIELNSNKETECDIVVYGQNINKSMQYKDAFRDKNSRTVLEVNNNIILEKDVSKYTSEILRLIVLNNSALELVGYINPRVKLGDIVYVDVEASTEIEPNYYRITGLDWILNGTLKCSARLRKVFE